MAPLTDYYKLYGKMVKHVEDGKTDKVLVLTTSKKEADVNAAIDKRNVLNNPTNELSAKLENAYDKTEASGKENYLEVGQQGKISKTVESKEAEVTYNDRADARRDLIAQGDKPSYDAHTHPLEKDKDGNIVSVGTPTPSKTDQAGSGTTPNVVLGYKQEVVSTSSSLGGSTTTLGGGGSKVETTRHI
ncbi:hypothetical protein [Niabella hirudinis]|uniref:hypothetical protein n=1 Tax=Niabella hirudinis TaxID=1285929 RepID=UPI003EB837A5